MRFNFEISFYTGTRAEFHMLSIETHGEAPGCRSSKVDCAGIPGERASAWGYRQCFMVKKNMGFGVAPSIVATIKADFRFDMDSTMIYRGFIGF